MASKEVMKDVLLRTRIESDDPGMSEERKVQLPVTRFEDILGAPRLLYPQNLTASFPAEYAFIKVGDISLSDEEYEACFGAAAVY